VLVIGTHGQLLSLHFSSLRGVVCTGIHLLWAAYWIFNARDNREPVLGLTLNFMMSLPLALLYCALTGQLTPWPGKGWPVPPMSAHWKWDLPLSCGSVR
jgi:drug/metabolite transporter (DMT)-like permease